MFLAGGIATLNDILANMSYFYVMNNTIIDGKSFD